MKTITLTHIQGTTLLHFFLGRSLDTEDLKIAAWLCKAGLIDWLIIGRNIEPSLTPEGVATLIVWLDDTEAVAALGLEECPRTLRSGEWPAVVMGEGVAA